MKNKTYKIETALNKLQSKEYSWEGITQLFELEKIDNEQLLINACYDSFWLVRWGATEKIANLKISGAINTLLEMLEDPDKDVQNNVIKAIDICSKSSIKPLALRCCDHNVLIQEFAINYIQKNIITYYQELELLILHESWFIANKLLLILFQELKSKIEPLLLKSIKVSNTQRHSIMMLAIIGTKKAIPCFIEYYRVPKLKRHIIEALGVMDKDIAYPRLIDYLNFQEVSKTVQEIILKINVPILKYLIQRLSDKRMQKDILFCIKKMPLENKEKESVNKFLESLQVQERII